MTHPLAGKCVLIVEDEPIIALDLAGELAARGAKVVSPVGVEAAIKAARDAALDGAIVDINLMDRADFPIISTLVDRRVPLVLTTSYQISDGMPAGLLNVYHFEKPVPASVLCRALEEAILKGWVPRRGRQCV